jgi:hypothetical protein
VFLLQNEKSRGRQKHKKGTEKITEPYPRKEKNKERVKRQKHSGGKIVLIKNQNEKNSGYQSGRNDTPGEYVYLVLSFIKKMRQIQGENEFNQFRGLERKRAHSYPPGRSIFTHAYTRNKSKSTKDYTAKQQRFYHFSQQFQINYRSQKKEKDSESPQHDLPVYEVESIAVVMFLSESVG